MIYFSRLSLYLVLILLLNYSSIAQEKASADSSIDYVDALQYFFSLKNNGEYLDVASEIVFDKDVATYKLKKGKLYTCTSYKGIPYALLFIGDGEFLFTPPSDIEKKQLYRFYDSESFSLEFKELFLLFDDNTYDTLIDTLLLKKIEPHSLNTSIGSYLSALKNKDDQSRGDFLRSMMTKGRNGFFYSQIQENDFEPVYFQIDPYEPEEVSFSRGVYYATKSYRELINLFPAKYETVSAYSSIKPNKYILDLISYNIESIIEGNLDFSANCRIDFSAQETDLNWIMFSLYDELQVDSVLWEDSSTAKFMRVEESRELWIKCKSEYLNGDQHSMNIYYHGDLLEKNELGWIELGSSVFWYPRYNNREKSKFDLTFHTPSKYQLISIGDLVNSVEQEDVIITTWKSSTPSRNVSFNIGNFEVYEAKEKDIPVVNVYISEYGHQYVSSYLRSLGILSLSDASEYIAQDISSSILLFSNLFGSLPLNSLSATEIPYAHGEAFPGLIHLSWATVVQTNFKGEDEVFRAHEAAHQWWGIAVDFKSYHDQWLSEGFSEYSGLWYLQAAKKDNDLFFEILEEWKDDILNVREYLFGSGQEAGPVWLGYRTSSTETRGDYSLIVYKKGAWILHMLRAMLLDLNTMNEDKIKNLLQDYYSTYKNKSASTKDFKRIVDKHFGEDMSWFFNQYVYGTDIPLYKVAYKSEKTEDEKTQVSIRVRQEEVPENFKMYIPIKLVLNGERVGRFRIELKEKETIITLPPFDGEVDEFVFNDLESVLCEVEHEDWD